MISEKTRMETYLEKEKDWNRLSKGVWVRKRFKSVRLNFPRAYVASSLTNLPSQETEEFKKHLENLAETVERHGISSIVPHRDTDPEKNVDTSASTVYSVDETKVAHSGVVVADVSHPSTGSGMELEIAKSQDVPIILLMRKNTRISRMPLGHPGVIASIEYEDYRDAEKKFAALLKRFLGKPDEMRKRFAEAQRTKDRKLFC